MAYEVVINNLIQRLCKLHQEFSTKFVDKLQDNTINFKKKEVRQVIQDDLTVILPSFLQLLQEYQEDLMKLMIELDYEYEYSDLDFRMRIKQMDSVFNKLFHYRYGKTEAGGIPLNKCLNDMLGFRILIPGFCHGDGIRLAICEGVEYRLRHTDASKEGYKATHVYFLGDNKYFPWELQIWNPQDAEQNERLHKEHKSKRGYITWPQKYKESEEYEEEGGGE